MGKLQVRGVQFTLQLASSPRHGLPNSSARGLVTPSTCSISMTLPCPLEKHPPNRNRPRNPILLNPPPRGERESEQPLAGMMSTMDTLNQVRVPWTQIGDLLPFGNQVSLPKHRPPSRPCHPLPSLPTLSFQTSPLVLWVDNSPQFGDFFSPLFMNALNRLFSWHTNLSSTSSPK